MKKRQKKEVYKEPYNVDELREIYAENVEYLNAVKKLKGFNNSITKEVKKYEYELKDEFGLNELKKEEKKLSDKLMNYNKLKAGYSGYEDEIEEYDNFSEKQIEEYFETLKKLELLKRKIKKEEEKIKGLVYKYEEELKKQNKDVLNGLKFDVLEKGLRIIDVDAIKNEKKLDYDFDDINQMLIYNKYFEPYEDKYVDNNASAQMIYWNLKLNNWFGNILTKDYDNTQIFKDEKLSKDYPSTFKYFIKSLEKHTGKKYKKVNIITNETHLWRHEYDPDEYNVFGATILAPIDIAETLLSTETKQTKEKIRNLAEKYNDIFILNSSGISYYERDFDTPNEEVKKNAKFNETYRRKARAELSKMEESNQIKTEDLLGIKDHEYNLHEEEIVEDLPTKEVAEAVFDTLEYAKRLVRLSELKKVAEKRKKEKEVLEEYEELKKAL